MGTNIKHYWQFRFMLLRHWSLYESMYYSNYVASKLGTWRAKGQEKLKELFAKMGFPLDESKQKYPFMKVSELRASRPHLKLN